jgi:hypothetical protein
MKKNLIAEGSQSDNLMRIDVAECGRRNEAAALRRRSRLAVRCRMLPD